MLAPGKAGGGRFDGNIVINLADMNAGTWRAAWQIGDDAAALKSVFGVTVD
jgi:hypothetical protein